MKKIKMKKYKLTEKVLTKANKQFLKVSNIKNRFFFQDDDCYCYTLQYHINFMKKNNLTEMDLWLAEREANVDYFYCKFFQECGIKSESNCGKLCSAYKPRNKKSGICKYFGYSYKKTKKCFTLKLLNKTKKNEKNFKKMKKVLA